MCLKTNFFAHGHMDLEHNILLHLLPALTVVLKLSASSAQKKELDLEAVMETVRNIKQENEADEGFMEVTTREMLSLVMVAMDTPLDLTASKMFRRNVTRFHNSTPDQSVTKLRPRFLMRSAVALMSAETNMPMDMEVTTKCKVPHATSCIFLKQKF